MKSIIIIILILVGMIITSFKPKDESPDRKQMNTSSDNPSAIIDSKQMDANSISTWYRTNGSFNRDPTTGNAGFEWPKGSGKTARYASGIWIGCVSGNDTLVAVAEYSYDFQPGYIDNSGEPQTDSSYRIYRIDQSNINSYDYLHWPGNQGAYMTTDNKPFLLGDETMYFVLTDGFGHSSNNGNTRPLNVQILQTNWSYNPYEPFLQYPVNPFNNTIFMEYRIINRSNETWNNLWISIWSDDDLGTATDDKISCDTNLNLGYTYNATNNDGIYGIAPPAVGLKFLRGNYKYTGNTNDTVKYFQPFGSKNIKTKIGYIDEGMTVFNFYNGGSPPPADPQDPRETYNVLKGWWKDGRRWISPTGDTTNKVFPGDPVTGAGWNQSQQNDIRSLTGTGPYDNVNPGDTLTLVVAQIIARGSSNLNSITQLRHTARIMQNFYENNLAPQQLAPSPAVSSYAPGKGKITLTWNDTTQSQSFKNILSGGTYNFQGYNIYQIRSYASQPSANDTVLLRTFDIRDGIKNILDSTYIPPNPGIFYGIVQRGSDNGISKYFGIDKDTLLNKEFVNGTEYKFAVTTYYYDPTGGLYTFPKVWESPKSNIIKVIPQNLTLGTQTSYNLGDTIYTDQKDLAVMPVIFDPLKLVNANYTSTFGGTNENPNWTVTRNINGSVTTLFENIYDFSGQQDSVKTADGLMFNHRYSSDSGIINDPDAIGYYNYFYENRRVRAWDFEPAGMEWFTAPDTNAIYNASYTPEKVIKRQFQSRSLGMSFATYNTFRNSSSQVKATGNYFKTLTPTSNILTGGPLRKIKIIFGQSQKAYRYRSAAGNVLMTDTVLINTPYADFVNIPFSVFTADELDSINGNPRQLNIAFIDADNDGTWNPDTTGMGRFQYTYILASTYDSTVLSDYIGKNPGFGGGSAGFTSMDIMYVWLPRVKSNNGVPARWNDGDALTVTPFRITRPDFVPGYPVKYNWEVKGTDIGDQQLASSEINNIKVFPNPYYGFSELEYNDSGEKFIYFSHLPQVCTILIYSLDGSLVNKIERTSSNPDNSLEKWDLKNEGGSYVASGMYIAVVDCKELGAKTLKMAVFTR